MLLKYLRSDKHTHTRMMDTLSKQERSERMSKIRCKDSKSEMKLRRLIHGMGFRYRLHVTTLPGTPDLVFPSRKSIIFMHGCFWHRHQGCRLARIPKSKVDFWTAKLEANKIRDERNCSLLKAMGWRIMVVWECQIKGKNLDEISNIVKRFLLANKIEVAP